MTTLPLADVRARFSALVEEAEKTHERIDVTRNGRRAAVLLGADDFDSLMETLEILSDPQAMRDIREADEQFAQGEYYGQDDVREAMIAAGRL